METEVVSIPRQEATRFLRTLEKKCNALTNRSRNGRERITHRFYGEHEGKLIFTECTNGDPRGRITIGYDESGNLTVVDSFAFSSPRLVSVLPPELIKMRAEPVRRHHKRPKKKRQH